MTRSRALVPILTAFLSAGCGQTTSPALPAAGVPAAAVVPAAPAEAVPGEARPVVAPSAETAAPRVTLLPGAEALAAEADQDDPPALNAFMALSDPPSYRIDDYTPYGVVVIERSAHTATIYWHTDVPTRGVIQYGRAWGFGKHGFTHQFRDDVAKRDHQITLTGLRRWTGYVFKVTSVSALGLQFQDQERKFRTKFWSWR